MLLAGGGRFAPGSAAIISGTFDITVTDFFVTGGLSSPVDPLVASITVSFDNSVIRARLRMLMDG
jgi:hypothetical protein